MGIQRATRRHLAALWLICMTVDLDNSWRTQVAPTRFRVIAAVEAVTWAQEAPRAHAGCRAASVYVQIFARLADLSGAR